MSKPLATLEYQQISKNDSYNKKGRKTQRVPPVQTVLSLSLQEHPVTMTMLLS